MAKISNIAASVEKLVKPYVEEKGCTLWDVEYVKEGGLYILRITIDKEGGVDIADCEAVHRAIDPVLDEADPIPQAYDLEVSSPGVERVIRTPLHIAACLGQIVEVKLFSALDGVKQFRAVLDGYESETDTVRFSDFDGAIVGDGSIPREKISRMQVYYDFTQDEV